MEAKRERLSSRLGFILLAAGCAIGLGNVWRFPYVVGQNGGAAFVLIYLIFLLLFGIPIMVMEFSVGRASQQSVATSFRVLESGKSKWHHFGKIAMIGNYLLMMFYTTIGGWVLNYLVSIARGDFVGANPEQVNGMFSAMLANPFQSVFWMIISTAIGFAVCLLGLENGVEKITKIMMSTLLVIMVALAVRSVMLEGAWSGLEFYLKPNFSTMKEHGIFNVVSEAMAQAFFTLSIGMGSMAIFGSYIEKERSLTGEAINITILDTLVALIAGLIIFPACSAFGVDVTSGPKLVFVTLPNIFNEMAAGRLWGTLFFVFMFFAVMSTMIAVFENIVAFGMDLLKWSRKKSVIVNVIALIILALPCALGSNVLSFIQPLGSGTTILDFEDFLVSNNILPIGCLIYVLFCTTKFGWGYDNFIEEANQGKGIKFPKKLRLYFTVVLPILIIFIFIQGYIAIFS